MIVVASSLARITPHAVSLGCNASDHPSRSSRNLAMVSVSILLDQSKSKSNLAGKELCRSSDIGDALDYLGNVNIHMGHQTALPWTIDVLTSTLASEMFQASPNPTLSVLGVLGSESVKEQASALVDSTLVQLTRSFVYISTFLHTYSSKTGSGIPRSGLKSLLAYMLFEITHQLDNALKPRQLATCSGRQLKCLFLVLIGLSVAATYPGVCVTTKFRALPNCIHLRCCWATMLIRHQSS